MKPILLGSACALLLTLGQVCWKYAIMKTSFSFTSDLSIKKIVGLVFSPYMITGIIIYVFATVFWIYLLSKYEYSKIYPMIASAYIFALIFAYYFFHESIGWYKISGVISIIIGIVLISRST